MLENIKLAFKGIWSHKMRSFLTMLGIIIGIAAIISIVSTIKGTNEQIKNNLVGSGNNTVNVRMTQGGEEYDIYENSSIPSGIPQVTQATLDRIEELDEVEKATAYTSRYTSESIYYQNTSISNLRVYGIESNYFATANYAIAKGRGFIADDYSQYRTVVILDRTAAQNLFTDTDPIGKTIEISKVPFTVIGVVAERSAFEPDIQTIDDYYTYKSDSNGMVYIPKASWPIIFSYDEPENVLVKASSTDVMPDAGKKSADILNENVSNKDNVKYAAEDLLKQASALQKLSNTTNMQLIWIAGISLLVGGIGVMNIMLVSVTERTAEIGLKKAIGAPKKSILAQFLTEAAVLTSLGGILGVASGVGASQIIHKVSGVAVGIDIPASVIAVVFSMAIGLIFGFLPSVQAANLDPIDALRRE